MRKAFLAGVLSVGLLLGAVGLALPASAAPSLVDNGDGSITVSGLGGGPAVFFCAVTVLPDGIIGDLPEPCNPVSSDYDSETDGTYTAGSTVFQGGAPVSLPAGTYTISIFVGGTSTGLSPVTIGSGGGGTSSESSPPPQTLTLSINTVEGSSCSQSSVSGIAGTWIDLPAADDCTPPASKAGATLLGWATNPDFPVEIAQRQIDNGWGAYEMYNDEGRLTAVFIPAGGPTFLSGDGNLVAVWSE